LSTTSIRVVISGAVRHGAPARARPGVAAGEMHVWHAWLDQPAVVVEQLHGLLAEDERARAASFHFDRDRGRYVVGRGLLRSLLAAYTGAAPRDLEFRYGEFDKPRLAGTGPRFNISHSGAIALLVFVEGVEVGIDVELEGGDEFPRDRIAERFFSPAEVAALGALPAPERPRAFLRCWTRKEAFIKARGDGLSLPLDSFDVTLAPGEPAALLRTAWSEDEPSEWWLQDLSDRARSYVAAVALRGPAPRLVIRDVSDDILSAGQPKKE
jgi:4'-phosphopantetheinyl transferase